MCQREHAGLNSPVIREEDCAGERGKTPQVVSDGQARYRAQSDVRVLNVSWVVPRRNSFVPDVDEGIFCLDKKDTPVPRGTGVGDPERAQGVGDMKSPRPKEARMNMKINFRIEAMSCLLERSLDAERLLDDGSKLEE